jgi:glycerol-3-phosphate acyltransferase PlsY
VVIGAALVVLGYVCGSIPFGMLLARRAGVDVRRAGSGNIGAANVARTAGGGLGALTLAADVAKGAVPVLVARAVAPGATVATVAGIAAVLGHLFPAAHGFVGGKGVATAFGVLVVLAPAASAGALGVFVATFAFRRYASLASLAAAWSAPAFVGLLRYPVPVLTGSVVLAVLITARHRENLKRLRAGVEPRFALHKKQALHTK